VEVEGVALAVGDQGEQAQVTAGGHGFDDAAAVLDDPGEGGVEGAVEVEVGQRPVRRRAEASVRLSDTVGCPSTTVIARVPSSTTSVGACSNTAS